MGYADDMATSSTSKNSMDRIMSAVYAHGRKWRYSFNASKSAVLVYGETPAERSVGSNARVFKLGPERVKERLYYDHMGVKTSVKGDTFVRTEEKVSKARKCLNMSTSIGIKRGINIKTCNIIYWSVVLPTLCFGCEVWFIKQKDIDILLAFQRYAARRVQRLHPRSLNITSETCLGWMSFIIYIKARKLIFLRTIACMEEYFPLKGILTERVNNFRPENGDLKESPINQMLQYSVQLGLLEYVQNMSNGRLLSKSAWEKLVWERAWECETVEWHDHMTNNPILSLVRLISPFPTYSIWWQISDYDHRYMRRCETTMKLLCHASLLRYDDCRLKNLPFGAHMCILCDNASYEDARHMFMQCEFHQRVREEMLNRISNIANIAGQEVFRIIMGKFLEEWSFYDILPIWHISCTYISGMYKSVLEFHKEFG